jgi:hypothetical protein
LARNRDRAPGGDRSAIGNVIDLASYCGSSPHRNPASKRCKSTAQTDARDATAVIWQWRSGPVDVFICPGDRRPGECDCLLMAAREMARAILLRHARPTAADIVTDCIRLALGPGRIATVQLVSPTRPDFMTVVSP